MPFKVSDEEKPRFNKRVQESFTLLSEQLEDVAFQGAASEEPAIELDSIRDADGNIISNSLDLFSTPLNGDKSKALGLVDADGNATDKGELFFNMKETGMFDDTGVITDKGKAYLMKPIELKDPKNLPAFTQLWDDGVIRGDETTWKQKGEALMDFGGNILGGIGEIGSNFGKNLYYQLDNRKGFGIPYLRSEENDNTPEWLRAENVAVNLSAGEKIATNLMEMGRMVDVASAAFETSSVPSDPRFASIGRPSPIQSASQREDVKVDDQKLYASRQRQWAMRETLKDLEVGEVAEMITEVKGIVDEAEKAKEVIGDERFKKIVERIGATTEMFGSPENFIPASFAFDLAKLVPLGNRVTIGAQKVLSKVLIKEAEIGALETSLEAAKLTVEKGAISNRLTSKFIEEGAAVGATPVAISRGQKAAEIAARTAKITDEATAAIPGLTSNLDEAVKLRNSLSTRIPETAANATLKTLEAGRQLRGLPAKAIGGALEGFGNTLTKIDGSISNFLKERGLDQMYSAALGAAGVVGVAGSPVIGAIGAGAAALKAGKMITNYGKLFKYVGKEMVKVKGQIPFWKRVAAHTEAGSLNRGIAHSFNMLDLGGVTSDTLRRIPRGIAAAAPSDLMFEWLSDGADMRPETLYQALAESVYIGGSFAAAGGAFMGTKTRMRQLAIGDQLNFNQSLTDPRQKVLYNQLDPGTRNSIATYSIANPTLNYIFKDNGASNYDPNTNTATINVNSNNSIKPLIAHETLHHTLIKNNMEAGISALFLGDTVNNTVGGLLRSKDGKLDPNFKAFTDAYYQRLNIAGMTDAEKNAIYPLDKMAVEYFIEQHSDQYAGMAESGELGAIAASGDIKRKLSGVLETVLPRIPVLRDLHFKSGGMIDKDGGWVTGNGILDTGGVKTNPITNKMFRDMNRRSSGLAPGQFEPLVSDKQDSGAQLSLDPSNPIDSELLHPLVKVDENGSPVLVDGKPVALDKVTLLQRALAGLTAKEVMSRKKAENYIPEKGEAHVDDAGEFQPGWLSNDILAEMFAKNSFNPEQKRIIREMNRMIRKGDGGRAVMINFPATTRNKAGKVVYKAQGATLRDTVPVAITISKEGNLLFGLMSVNKLQENIQKRSQSRRGKKLYGGNVDLILRDTQAMMQFHKDGVDSIEYFKEKYGAVEATERKNFINTMFGLLNQKEQAVLNPMLIEDGVKSRDNVYRTYRADRVSKAVAMSPDDYPAMPFSYEAASQVKMPEQSRQMPEIAVVPERFTGSATDTDRRGKYVEPPGFFRKFNIDSYERGGRFFDAASGEDLTGKQYSTGSIDVSTGKPRLFVDNVSDVTPSGNKFKTNLFKQKAGWKWTSENPPSTSTIVSVEGQGKHIYTLKANFEGGVELARYSEKASEPRLRPTAYGEMKIGEKVGEISIRGKSHPVYDSVGIIPKIKEQSRQMPEEPITSSSERWRSMSNKEKDAYVFTPVEMTPSNRAEFNARVESGSLSADTPVVDINRSNLLTSKYGPPSSSATGNINTWIDDNTGKPVAVAFSENGNIPTKGERTPVKTQNRFMPEALDEDKFYSQLDRVITDKIPSRATPQQIMATIDPTRGSGVKAEEIKWSGIEQALKSLEKDGKVSKEDLLNYLRNEGQLQLKEVELRDNQRDDIPSSYLQNRQEELLRERAQEEADGNGTDPEEEYDLLVRDANQLSETIEQAREEWLNANPTISTEFSKYTLPGGENYREVVLAMPQDKSLVEKNKTAEKLRKERKKIDNRLDEIQRLAKTLTQSGDTNPKAKMQMEELGKEYTDLIEKRNLIPLESTQIQISEYSYTSSHFPNIPNYVAHMRLNERTDGNGNSGLFVEEFQSDRHQEGRKKGYNNERGVDVATREFNRIVKPSTDVTSKEMQELVLSTNARMIEWAKEKLGEDYDRIRELARQDKPSVADAPFRTTWPIQMFKRALRDAVDGNKDWIGWTVGETQNERFDLSKSVDKIAIPMVNADSRSVRIDVKDGSSFKLMVNANGIIDGQMSASQFSGKKLDEVIGKDMADKIMSAEKPVEFEGDDLKVGGSGMKGFYDNMLPKEISKYVKQWGGKVEKSDIPTKNKMGTGIYEPIWRVDITPEMKKGVAQGQARYMPEKEVDVKTIEKSDTDTEQGTPAPDSDVQSIPLTGNPIPWDRIASRQVRFMPEAIRDAFPTMSPELLAEIEKETSTLAAIHIDRMRVGEYMGIDLQGGMFYPTIKENLENGIVWAFNSTGVARTVANRAAQNNGYVKLVLMQEGNVVGNKTFANIWFKILSDSIEKKQISKGLALTELNAARRTVYKTLENKDIKKNPWVVKHAKKWNSIEEAKQAILSMPQIERGGTYFKKSKTETKAEGEKIAYQALLSQKMAKLGFPDARKIVNDIEEPAFKGIPTGAAVAIIKFDPLGANDKIMTANEAGVPEHMSYGYVLKGKPIAKLAYYQVVEETFPTTKGQIMTQQHTDFPVSKSIPSKEKARGEIKYNQATQLAIAKAAKLK